MNEQKLIDGLFVLRRRRVARPHWLGRRFFLVVTDGFAIGQMRRGFVIVDVKVGCVNVEEPARIAMSDQTLRGGRARRHAPIGKHAVESHAKDAAAEIQQDHAGGDKFSSS